MNYAFGNDCAAHDIDTDLSNCHLITVPREGIEADRSSWHRIIASCRHGIRLRSHEEEEIIF